MNGVIAGLLILFSWSISLFLCHYHTVLNMIALYYSLQSGNVMPTTLLFFQSCFGCSKSFTVPTNFRISFFLFIYFCPLHTACRIPNQGSNSCPLQWKCGVLTTELPGKSWVVFFFLFYFPKKCRWNFHSMHWLCRRFWFTMDILTILIFPIHVHRVSFHLFESSLNSFNVKIFHLLS